ncbi:MAG: SMP-30/gluconolactonase/LRE family protein [Rudaea sp.]|uniref:SMP-30/gluconolactonase/LRE family protein n=1 Tax=Rudaea sp. TaxID=2136325 RepID=UPI0039E27931
MTAVARLAVDSRCMLGEGVLWNDRDRSVLWTDIHAARLWRYRPGSGEVRSWRLPDRLGSFALCESGRLLLALAKQICSADLDAAEADEALPVQPLAAVEPDEPNLRCNDGRADRAGNFVFGTLDEGVPRAPRGRFHQYSARHGLRALDLGGVAIPNSLGFGLDGRSLYFCDTCEGRIMRCDYDADSAGVGRPEPFAEVEPPAAPDGAAVDRFGRLWSAQWGASRIVCYDRDGRVAQRVDLPTRQPSCIAFGGPGLDVAYITTAREDLDADALAREPHAGGLFAVRFDAPIGLRESRFDDR